MALGLKPQSSATEWECWNRAFVGVPHLAADATVAEDRALSAAPPVAG